VIVERRAVLVTSHQPPGYTCPFCAVVAGRDTSWNAQSDVVFRDAATTAFIAPKWWVAAPAHVLVVPNEHFENVYVIPESLLGSVYATSRRIACALKASYECDGTSMRQHNEPGGGQDVWHSTSMCFPAVRETGCTPATVRHAWCRSTSGHRGQSAYAMLLPRSASRSPGHRGRGSSRI